MHAPRLWGTLDPFVETGPIMGRKVANTAFLDALLRSDPYDGYHFFMPSPRECAIQRETLAGRYPALAEQGKLKVLTRTELPDALAETRYAVFHLSDCITSQARLAVLRNAVARSLFPITGTTHSLSYASYAQAFLPHVWPGTTRRDAIVATSRAGKRVVREIFASLRQGYALAPDDYPEPEVVRIPLGVDCTDWSRLEGDARLQARRRWDVPAEATMLLVFGRVSHSSKMDLVPLLRALQRAVGQGVDLSTLVLVVAGWTDDDATAFVKILSALAANVGLMLRVVPRPSDADKRVLFGMADIFVSLSDNPQETFGLTLLEAMAAGLPVIASDYDGYRDIVIDGQTGLLVSTLGEAETDTVDVLAPLCYDNHVHLLLAQQLAVDVPATAAALGRLITDPDLRREMGRAGRERALAVFSWDTVITDHLALWDRLAAEPVPDRERLRTVRHPASMVYGRVFAGYSTTSLSDAVRVCWSRTGQAVYRKRDFPLVYQGIDRRIDMAAVRTLLFLARGGCPAATLASRLAVATGLDPFDARFHVLWALKQDLLEKTAAHA